MPASRAGLVTKRRRGRGLRAMRPDHMARLLPPWPATSLPSRVAALTAPRCTPTGRRRRSWVLRCASWATPAATMSSPPKSSSARVSPLPRWQSVWVHVSCDGIAHQPAGSDACVADAIHRLPLQQQQASPVLATCTDLHFLPGEPPRLPAPSHPAPACRQQRTHCTGAVPQAHHRGRQG